MGKPDQVVIPEQTPSPRALEAEETRVNRLELFLRKIVLAALTMLGIGYILVNAPMAILIGNSISAIPIASLANVNAIAGRVLFFVASTVAILLGGLFIFGAVQFYAGGQTRGVVFLGVLFGCFYLICLGVGSVLLLSETSLSALFLTVSPILVAASAATHSSFDVRLRLLGSVTGVAGGVMLGYAIFSLPVFDLVFAWGLPFTGPFMSFAVLEGVVVVLGAVAACAHAFLGDRLDEHSLPRVLVVFVGLVYGLGAFVGSAVLAMGFWNFIWKSAWVGPFFGLSEWVMNLVVFWSASLILLDIGGILLVVGACLGFVLVSREFSRL